MHTFCRKYFLKQKLAGFLNRRDRQCRISYLLSTLHRTRGWYKFMLTETERKRGINIKIKHKPQNSIVVAYKCGETYLRWSINSILRTREATETTVYLIIQKWQETKAFIFQEDEHIIEDTGFQGYDFVFCLFKINQSRGYEFWSIFNMK